MIRLNELGLILLIGTIFFSGSVVAQTAEDENSDTERRTLEEIVVTAARREESLQDTSIAISAITGDFLTDVGAKELDDYFGFVPSVNSASNTIGERGGKNILIRGISNTRIATGDASQLSNTTAFYLNDIAITAVDTQLFDVDRVEVLRGPQGTLYGAASQGGAVKLFLNKPNLEEIEGAVQGSFSAIKGGEPGGDLNGMINIPVYEGILGVRLVGSHLKRDGYIDTAIVPLDNTSGRIPSLLRNDLIDVIPGKASDRVIEAANERETTGATFSALYTPSEKLSIEVTELWQLTKNDDLNFANNRFGGSDSTMQEKYILEPSESEVTLSALTVSYDFDAFTLVSNSGYYTREYEETIDWAQVIFNGGGFNDDLDFIPAAATLDTQMDINTFTQEVRLESNREAYGNPVLSRLDWVLGAFYMDSDRDVSQVQEAPGWEAAAPGYPLALGNDVWALSHDVIAEKSEAVFLDLTYNISDRFSVGGGIRFFDLSRDTLTADLNRADPENVTRDDLSFSESDHSIRFSASYDVDDSTKVFASFSDGFRLGGAVGPVNFDTSPECAPVIEEFGLQAFASGRFNSDDVETYELGLKKAFGNGRATLNASAYTTEWSGLQTQLRLGDLSTTCFATITANVGSAKIDGLEVELAALATDYFSVQASLAYTDAQIDDPGPSLQESGDKILNVPEFAGSLVARYEVPTDALGGGTLFIQGDVRHVGEREPVTGNENPLLTLEEYTLVGARVGIVLGGEKPITLTLWGKNLTDDNVDQNARNRIGVSNVVVNQGLPRTFGITLRKDF